MKTVITFVLFLLSHCLVAQNDINVNKLNDYLSYIERNDLGAGRLSVFKNGKEVYAKDFGQINIPGLRYNGNTKYQIGSVTKMLTATLIFKLVEKNKVSLDDKLSLFLPAIPNSDKITIKNLLEHTSGLGSYVVKNGEIWVTEKVSDKQIMDVIVQQGKSFEPAEKVAYSNTAYYLLTKIVEEKYGQPFHEIVNKEIIKPLKLRNTASAKSKPKNVFLPYHYENDSWQPLEKDIDFLNVIGVGDMVSTPYDLNVFVNNLFHNKILKKESLTMMEPILGIENWGRGMAIWDFDGLIFYGHGGDTLGSHAVLIYNKDNDISIAYDTNAERINKDDFVKNIVFLLYDKKG